MVRGFDKREWDGIEMGTISRIKQKRFVKADECKAILSSKSIPVYNISRFFTEIEKTADIELSHLKRIFGANLFGLNGDEHIRLKRLLRPFFSAQHIGVFQAELETIVQESIAILEPNARVDLFRAYIQPLSFDILCLVLGLPRHSLSRYISSLESVRSIIDFSRPLKIRDYLRIEADAQILVERIREDARAQSAKDRAGRSFYRYHRMRGIAEEDTINYMIVMLAGSGAVENTLANAFIYLLSLDSSRRNRFFENFSPAQAIERLLFIAGGADVVYREVSEKADAEHLEMSIGDVVVVDLEQANRAETEGCDWDAQAGFPARATHFAFGRGAHRCIGDLLSSKILESSVFKFFAKFPHTKLSNPIRKAPLFRVNTRDKTLFCDIA